MEWLQIARNQAEERFRSLPFPSGKDENFRFTAVTYPEAGGDGRQAGASPPLAVASLAADEAALLVLGTEVSQAGQAPGALLTDLLRAATLGSEPVLARLRGEGPFRDDKFAQLTSARWRSGAFLHVPAGVRQQKPLRFLACAREAEEHFRHVLVLEEGAEAVVVQEGWSDGADRFVGELAEVKLGKNSRLHWVQLQQFGDGTEAVLRHHVELAEGAELRFTPLHVGGRLVQQRLEARLAGRGALFEACGAARGERGQHFDLWLDVQHQAAASRSRMDYWFVMAGKSRGVFNGHVEVAREAVGCESSQRAKSLLVGSGAVHAVPRLLIQTDDVKASHGAAVSSVSPEQLHYLQSRGIPRAEAGRMIVRGFTEAVVAQLPIDSLRERAEALLDGKQGGTYEQ